MRGESLRSRQGVASRADRARHFFVVEECRKKFHGRRSCLPSRRRIAYNRSNLTAPKWFLTVARAKLTRHKTNNGANVGYEAELWQMADALRGSMDTHLASPPVIISDLGGERQRKDKRYHAACHCWTKCWRIIYEP